MRQQSDRRLTAPARATAATHKERHCCAVRALRTPQPPAASERPVERASSAPSCGTTRAPQSVQQKAGRTARPLIADAFGWRCAALCLRRFRHRFWPIDQLHDRHRCLVALAETELEDAQITART